MFVVAVACSGEASLNSTVPSTSTVPVTTIAPQREVVPLLTTIEQILVKYGQGWARHISDLRSLYLTDRDAFDNEITDEKYWVIHMGTLPDVGLVSEEQTEVFPSPSEVDDGIAFYSALLDLHEVLTSEGLTLPATRDLELMLSWYTERR